MILETAVDRACCRWIHRMNTHLTAHDNVHLGGESATHPIEPPSGALAALLLLAGIEPASSSRLASPPEGGPLGRVQLPFPG